MEKKTKRGFALLSRDKHRKLARLGGIASHQANGHEWTPEEARAAGKKGGKAKAK
jgi:general stress protein YciG